MPRERGRWAEEKRSYPLVDPRGGIPIRLKQRRGIWTAVYRDADEKEHQKSLETRSISVAKTLALEGPWRLPIALAFYAGLRRAEVEHLRWESVRLNGAGTPRLAVRPDPDDGWVPKDHESREVPICAELAAILDVIPASDRTGAVCPPSPRIRADKLEDWLKKQGLPKFGFHGLRHSFGTYLAMAGVPLRTIQAWMGHASITTTQIYMAYVPGAEAGIEKLDLMG